MTLASKYILNQTKKAEECTIFPFIHDLCNLKRADDAFTKILVPDVSPAAELKCLDHVEFSTIIGEFLNTYNTNAYNGKSKLLLTFWLV